MTQENNSEWQYRFLKTGTEYGFGDLSAMVNVVSEILKEECNAVLSEVERESRQTKTKEFSDQVLIITNNLRVK